MELFQPFLKVLEGGGPGDVVDQKGADSSSVVGTGHGSVPLLSCGVPNLDFDGFAIDVYDFGCELYSDGGFTFEVELIFGESGDDV